MTPQQQHVALLAWVGLTCAAWCAVRLQTRRGAVELAGTAALMALTWRLFPLGLDVAWLNPLQEAASEELIRLARGEGAHAGPLWTRLLEGWARVPVVVDGRTLEVGRLDGVVRLGATAAVGGAAIAGTALRRWWWVVPAALLHRAAWWWVSSEGPSALAWLLAAMLGAVLLGGQDPEGRMVRASRRVAAVGLVVSLGLLRTELGAAAALVCAAAWAQAADADEARARRGLALAWAAGAGGAVVAELAVGGELQRWGRAAWLLQALHPLDPAPLVLPLLLVATLGPGLGALVVVGLVDGLRRPRATAGLAVALLLLFKLYYAAGHGPLLFHPGFTADEELVRYLGLALPLVVAVAGLGLARLPWRALALPWPGIALVWALWPYSTWWSSPNRSWMPVSLVYDQQIEVRRIVAALMDHPTCAVATRGAEAWVVVPSPLADEEGRRRRRVEGAVPAARLADELGVCVVVDVGITCQRHLTACEAPGWEPAEVAPWAHPDHGWGFGGRWLADGWVVHPTAP
jgi:hypothetical protein